MKVYLIYITIATYLFNSKYKYLIDGVNNLNYRYTKGDNVVVLYAWTTKKKYVKRFLSERCQDIFQVKTKEYDDEEEFTEFASNQHSLMLEKTDIALFPGYDGYERLSGKSIIDKDHFIEMVVTEYEKHNFSIYGSENMNEFGPKAEPDMDYAIFNDDIQEALSVLGYCTLYDSTYIQSFPESDEKVERFERAMHVINFSDDAKDKITNLLRTEYVIFIYLYSYTFVGKI